MDNGRSHFLFYNFHFHWTNRKKILQMYNGLSKWPRYHSTHINIYLTTVFVQAAWVWEGVNYLNAFSTHANLNVTLISSSKNYSWFSYSLLLTFGCIESALRNTCPLSIWYWICAGVQGTRMEGFWGKGKQFCSRRGVSPCYPMLESLVAQLNHEL